MMGISEYVADMRAHMNKERIANILYDQLSHIYCADCRRFDEEEYQGFCDYCRGNSNRWGISMAEAERIAEEIGGTEND